jgi:hypothetical protein
MALLKNWEDWTDLLKNVAVLQGIKEERNFLNAVQQSKADLFGLSLS